MCGRYTLHTKKDIIIKHYGLSSVPKDLVNNFNVAPGQQMPVVKLDAKGKKQLTIMKWGLIPTWAKEPSIGYKLINARDDSIFVKPIWKKLILTKRCLIPADGFYEWKGPVEEKGRKTPYYIHPKLLPLFSFAGIWEAWEHPSGLQFDTYTIITTKPNKEMASIHNRMPVILHPEEESGWLSPDNNDRGKLENFIHPYYDGGLEMHKVSEDVNSPRNNDEHLIYALS